MKLKHSAILAAITALGTVVGGLVYVFKFSAWAVVKTPEQKAEAIDVQVAADTATIESTGRPT